MVPPDLPALLLAITLRFDIQRRRDVLFCSTVALLLAVGYFAVYIITPNDLTWQLQTSLSRLYVQLWPIFLLAVFAAMRTPESTGLTLVETPAKSSKAKRKAKA